MKTLRLVVEKWLTPGPTTLVRITRCGRKFSSQGRQVRVDALRPEGPIEILFFRHDDGTWWVFPQNAQRFSMSVYPSN
ncbi:hypothetical protein [Paraburkholderia sediminicola]|uniref:hypothetical protein n=1 Tax=Paraburkholderia sediminicola TaxID=458836 RepID=UPI000E755F67